MKRYTKRYATCLCVLVCGAQLVLIESFYQQQSKMCSSFVIVGAFHMTATASAISGLFVCFFFCFTPLLIDWLNIGATQPDDHWLHRCQCTEPIQTVSKRGESNQKNEATISFFVCTFRKDMRKPSCNQSPSSSLKRSALFAITNQQT